MFKKNFDEAANCATIPAEARSLSIRNDHAGSSNLTVMPQHVLEEVTWVKSSKYQSPVIINEIIDSVDGPQSFMITS